MDFEFETTRTSLANAFAAAGAELLEYMGTAAAVAAIPDTEKVYAIAGTLPGILQMAGKMMGEEGAIPVEVADGAGDEYCARRLKSFAVRAEPTRHPDFKYEKSILITYNGRQEYPFELAPHEARKVYDLLAAEFGFAAQISPISAAEKPTGDLTDEQIMENYRELGGETWGQSQQAVADAFRNHVGAIATDDAAGPYVKFRFRSMADADAALESIIASFSAPASQEGAHAARNEKEGA